MFGIPLSAALLTACCAPQDPATQVRTTPTPLTPLHDRVDQPVELGQLRWRRDFAAGLAEARRTGKPALLLFQEVPG